MARWLSVLLACGGAAIAAVILVIPAYSTATVTTSSNGVTTSASGHSTVLAANPQAAPLLLGVVCVGVLIGVLGVLTAWAGSAVSRRCLAGLMVLLSVVAVLSLPSIGMFLLPVVVLGWMVVGSRRRDGGGVSGAELLPDATVDPLP